MREQGFPVEAVALHLPRVGELVARTGGGARGLCGLHREATHDVAFGEAGDRLFIAVADGGGIIEGGAQRPLDEGPHVRVDGFDAELIGNDPVGARGDLLDEVAVSGEEQATGSSGDHLSVGDEADGSRAITRDLEAVLGDGCTKGGVSIDGGRGAHVHVGTSELTRGELRDVVQGARGNRAHDRVLERSDVLAQDFDVLVAGVQGRRAREHVGFLSEGHSRVLQRLNDAFPCRGKGVLVGNDEHLFAREEAGKHRARLVENTMAKDDVLGVRRALEGGVNERS